MNTLISDRTIIFISGAWPGRSSGYAIANTSTLSYFNKTGCRCFYFGPAEEVLDSSIRNKFDKTEFIPVDLSRKPKAIRFMRSLLALSPAITERFWGASPRLPKQIHNRGIHSSASAVFFYEDIPAGWLMKGLKAAFPSATHILRSHNVVVKGFEALTGAGFFLSRWAWNLELKKIRALEQKLFRITDRGFAISDDDATWYREHLGIEPDGVIGFYIDFEEYRAEGEGEENLIYLGSADLRKGQALSRFIEEAWPIVRSTRPECKLILGGMGTKRFHDPDNGVFGLGFVESEADFMDKGSIFINPQQVGAGVKIKSLIALANSKLLVSTSIGVEGTGLKNNIHCIVEDDFRRQAELIIQYLDDKHSRNNIINQGKSYTLEHFSKEKFFTSMNSIFKTQNS